jgi:hypothetical protein
MLAQDQDNVVDSAAWAAVKVRNHNQSLAHCLTCVSLKCGEGSSISSGGSGSGRQIAFRIGEYKSKTLVCKNNSKSRADMSIGM